MKTQEEYALEIDEIVRRDVESRQSDWFKIDKEIFMQPENKNKAFILGTRKTGCDLITPCSQKSKIEKSAGRWRVYTISWSIKFNGPLYERTKQSIRLCFGISPLLSAVLVQYRVQQGQRMVRELLHWRHAQQH